VDGINALLARLGVHARKSREMTHKSTPFKAHTFWFSRIPVNECVLLRGKMTFIVPSKQARFESITPTEIKCVRSDFTRVKNIIWDTIVSIEEEACPTPFVYDFTVEGTRNFVHANGLCLRDTFHSAGTAKANATSGVPRIEELLGASPNPKRPSNTVYLRPNIASSQRECISKMKEIQKTTLRDVAKSVRIYYDPYPLAATTTVDEDRELLEGYEAFSGEADGSCGSPWIMRVALDDYKLNARDIRDLTKIQTALMNTSGLKIAQCRHSDSSAQNLILRIAFDPNAVKNPIQLRFLEDKVLDTVLTGVDGIGRVFLREVKNEMSYNETLGAYTTPKEKYYVLDVEGTNLYDLLVFDGVDGTRTFSNDIHEVHDVFGIEAARLCIYEEINEVFASEKVNYHHLAVLVDTMTFTGRIVPVSRTGMKKGETGVLAKSSFEETSKIMFNAATWAESDNMRGVSANIMFGQKPPCGTGFVDILIDEARLPEGPEEEPQNEALDTLNAVNQKLDSLPATTECRMEDILMEW
jgi:DNA-directed RNA polymerase II subunit RPB1